MKPEIAEIRKIIPGIQEEDEVRFGTNEEIQEKGMVETSAFPIGEWCAKVFKSSKIKNLILIILMVISVLDGALFIIPDQKQKEIIMAEIQSPYQWTLNVESSYLSQPKYCSLYFPSIPSPVEQSNPQNNNGYTMLAPISGSAQSFPNQIYQAWNSNSGAT